MLMKYKDFKVMSQNEMKEVKGGMATTWSCGCTSDADCPDADYECSPSSITLPCGEHGEEGRFCMCKYF